ncbi:pyridoxal-phosphate dependent enzyme [Erwinia sp. PsM31]|uniref:pyridoxal-phosphate dependent enzyme n=1 Tax=Erwinia sp. PsM31 TaxID=3030535 RepID=UPI00263BC950|nr:pyridoxal-phosphate dependent enzyme [Erwinia sp. PsM31]MDN4627721.1 pyridoxal-phosphate dependent enzyme [Erwinia sp. PsM31]
MHLHQATPLIPSRALSLLAGRDVWLKMEAFQPPGSFKIRGIGLSCQHYLHQGAERFVSSSGGNAGMAVAWAGRQLGVPVIVVVPETTSARAVELLRQENAEVIVHGASWQEANHYAQSLSGSKDAFLHPFDDPLLWQGHATMIDEVAADGCKPDVVILSVGGGGLLNGVVEGLQRNGWHDVPVIAVETEGAASFHAALQAGHTVELAAINSVAGSLGAKRVSEQSLRCAATHPIHSALVTDSQAIAACSRFLNDHRVLTEPACGASLAVIYDSHPLLAAFRKPLVIVCGGATVTAEQLWHLSEKR